MDHRSLSPDNLATVTTIVCWGGVLFAAAGACRGPSGHQSPAGADVRTPERDAPSSTTPTRPSATNTTPGDASAPDGAAEVSNTEWLPPLRGNLNGQHVILRLQREGIVLRGYYFGEGEGKDHELTGTVDERRQVVLEAHPGLKMSGSFDSDGALKGKLILDGSASSMAFVPVRAGSGKPARWQRKHVGMVEREPEQHRTTCSVDVAYVELVGALNPMAEARMNGLLKPGDRFLSCTEGERLEGKGRIVLNRDGLFSVEEIVGMWALDRERSPVWADDTLEAWINVDLVSGTRIDWPTVFLSDSAPGILELLKPQIAKRIEEGVAEPPRRAALFTAVLTNFDTQNAILLVEEDGVRVNHLFPVEGNLWLVYPRFLLPWKDLNRMCLLNTTGPVARFLSSAHPEVLPLCHPTSAEARDASGSGSR